MFTINDDITTLWAHRFTSPEDYNWFVKTMGRVVLEEFGEDRATMVEATHYFVDFLRYSCRENLLTRGFGCGFCT